MSPVLRDATPDDLPDVVRLILEDSLSSDWESGVDEHGPLRSLEAIEDDTNNRLIVAEQDGAIVGTFQLTFIPTLTLRGGWIAQIENVRADSSLHNQGLGQHMVEWAIAKPPPVAVPSSSFPTTTSDSATTPFTSASVSNNHTPASSSACNP
jgi:hypothetical protein